MLKIGVLKPNNVCFLVWQHNTLWNIAKAFIVTCRTMGSCSGGFLFSTPIVSQTWNAVSCSAKNGLCCGYTKYGFMFFPGLYNKYKSRWNLKLCFFYSAVLNQKSILLNQTHFNYLIRTDCDVYLETWEYTLRKLEPWVWSLSLRLFFMICMSNGTEQILFCFHMNLIYHFLANAFLSAPDHLSTADNGSYCQISGPYILICLHQ